jgi:hypothetical protein
MALNFYPLRDGFDTTLTQRLDSATGAGGYINVAATPDFTLPSGVTTSLRLDTGNDRAEEIEIDLIDSANKRLRIKTRNITQGNGVTTTAQTHPAGASCIISDSYAFWKAIVDAINGFSGPFITYADDAARDAAIPSPVDYQVCGNTAAGAVQVYVGGNWENLATGDDEAITRACSTTDALNGELFRDSGASNALKYKDNGGTVVDLTAALNAANFIQYAVSSDVSDTYTATFIPTVTLAAGVKMRVKFTTANTGACTLNTKAIKTLAGNDPQDGDIAANSIHELTYDGTNFILDSFRATSAEKGEVELSTDQEILAGSSTVLVPTVEQTDKFHAQAVGAGTTFTANVANTERSSNSTSYVKVKEIVCPVAGTYTVTFSLKTSSGSGTANGRIYKNGVAVGTERADSTGGYQTFAENLTFASGDLIQLYYKISSGVYSAYVKDFSVKYALTPKISTYIAANSTVNQD